MGDRQTIIIISATSPAVSGLSVLLLSRSVIVMSVEIVSGSASDADTLRIRPLGGGQEVGRSCILLEFKEKRLLLDCGIHPGLQGMASLPFLHNNTIETDQIDALLISHFHLDHAGALPWFLQKTTFRGKCFMTHATKAIYKWLLSDFIKVSHIATDQMLFSEQDLDRSMELISSVNFHEERECNGIRFTAFHAGHVLGAAMFMIEIASIRILYTGDYSREEDRHLRAAEMPPFKPDVLIIEATYGTHLHEKREEREHRFVSTVHKIVARGGRCLIPVFALGRAQELLLILDDYWDQHPDLADKVPIYYASALAKKCMAVYQTFIGAMNDRIRKQIAVKNPFVFRHISNLRGMDHFDDVGPSVVLASPGMLQSGLSRELFEAWCPDPKNGCIVAGYCVEGTLAKHILSEPQEVMSLSGQKLPLRMQVSYISFSAHADFKQTSAFIRALHPPNCVLVHGEANEMGRLKAALIREYENDPKPIQFFDPRNTKTVELFFKTEKVAKVVGNLAIDEPKEGKKLSGVLVKRNFNYHLMQPSDLNKYADLTTSTVTQRQAIKFDKSFELLNCLVAHMSGDVRHVETDAGSKSRRVLRAYDSIDLIYEPGMVTLEWVGSPVSDMYADCVLAAVLQADRLPEPKLVPSGGKVDRIHFKQCLIEMLQEMFGEESVGKTFTDDTFEVFVDEGRKKAKVQLPTMSLDDDVTVECDDDPMFKKIVHTACNKLRQSLMPAD